MVAFERMNTLLYIVIPGLNLLVLNQLAEAATWSSNIVRNLIRGSVLRVAAD